MRPFASYVGGHVRGVEVSSEKSLWPGVSSRLMTQSRYSICITELATEMPRCFSISIQSDVAWRDALRALTLPAIWMAPA